MLELESNNKDIRNFLETHSRKISRHDQITDVMLQLLEYSDPKILNLINLQRKLKGCKICGSPEHTIRSHRRKVEAAYSGIYIAAVMEIPVVQNYETA